MIMGHRGGITIGRIIMVMDTKEKTSKAKPSKPKQEAYCTNPKAKIKA